MASAAALEMEIAQMQERLATVKVVVEAERNAWKATSKTGKHGTKWRSAAASKPTNGSTCTTMLLDPVNGVPPSYWDALEVAQLLQQQTLTTYAKVVIHEQITGKMLLETPVSKLRPLFRVNNANDPTWQQFLAFCASLQTQQKQMESNWRKNPTSPPTSPSSGPSIQQQPSSPLFPQISPRVAPVSKRKQPSSSNQMVTCWNCNVRFPRTNDKTKSRTKSNKLFCSKTCQQAIEGAEMCISVVPKPSKITTEAPPVVTNQGLRRKSKSFQDSDTKTQPPKPLKPPLDGGVSLHIGGLSATPSDHQPARPPSLTTTRVGTSTTMNGSSSFRTRMVTGVPSIRPNGAPNLIPSLVLTSVQAAENSHHAEIQSRVFRDSRYHLDPNVYQANGISFSTCFLIQPETHRALHGHGPPSPRQAQRYSPTNLMRLQAFLSVKSLYFLSLTSRAWFELVHQSQPYADWIWGTQFSRLWAPADQSQAEIQAFLREIGVLSSKKQSEKPKKLLMKLTRQLNRIVLDNVKTLLAPESWQLAAPCREVPSSAQVAGAKRSCDVIPSEAALVAPLYEQIAIIYNRIGEIVAIKAQELVRPTDDQAVITDILQNIRSQVYQQLECRRLRLFSSANRLPVDAWQYLEHCHVVFEFFHASPKSVLPSYIPRVETEPSIASSSHSKTPIALWHRRIVEKMQKYMQKRLLGKESVQQLIKAVPERYLQPPILIHLERFLIRATAKSAVRLQKKPLVLVTDVDESGAPTTTNASVQVVYRLRRRSLLQVSDPAPMS